MRRHNGGNVARLTVPDFVKKGAVRLEQQPGVFRDGAVKAQTVFAAVERSARFVLDLLLQKIYFAFANIRFRSRA